MSLFLSRKRSLNLDLLDEAREVGADMEKLPKNNDEPWICDRCLFDHCMVECEFEVGLDSMTNSISAVELEHRVVRSVKTIINETESAKYSPARCKTLLSEVFKILSGKDYKNVCKRISKDNKFIVKILPVRK